MNIFFLTIAIGLTLWVIGTLVVVRGIEGPKFRVIEKKEGYEIREYEPYIVAEVEVEGTMKKALSAGFRQLAKYIFGGNTSTTSIGVSFTLMEMSKTPESIAMTVPVMESTSGNEKHTIAFTMPSKYTLETLPKPNNANIRFRTVEHSRKAVLRYTGYATEKKVEAKKKILKDQLNRDGYVVKGEIISAQYNPPMSFPLLRRNEVMVDLK